LNFSCAIVGRCFVPMPFNVGQTIQQACGRINFVLFWFVFVVLACFGLFCCVVFLILPANFDFSRSAGVRLRVGAAGDQGRLRAERGALHQHAGAHIPAAPR
jgi:hypothetical protein